MAKQTSRVKVDGGVLDAGPATEATLELIRVLVNSIKSTDGIKKITDPVTVNLITGFATEAKQLADGHSVALSAIDNAVLDAIDAVLDAINAKLVSGTVIGDVNLGAVDNAVLDSIVTKLGDIDTGKLEEATFTGRLGEVQASPTANTLLARLKDLLTGISLTTSSAAIGKLAANSGVDIGDVDVLSIPWPDVFKDSTKVDVDNSAVLIFNTDDASNSGVKAIKITNSGVGDLYVCYRNGTPTTVSYHLILAQGETSPLIPVRYVAATSTLYDVYAIRADAQTNDDVYTHYFY